MPELLIRDHSRLARRDFERVAAPDERAGRRALRAQIARLDRELSQALAAGAPWGPVTTLRGRPALQSLGDLERQRDRLVDQIAAARAALAALARTQTANRQLVEAMIADPAAHPWERVTRAQIGEPGCGAYEVRPRLGLIGMLADWWQVKLSSGCP